MLRDRREARAVFGGAALLVGSLAVPVLVWLQREAPYERGGCGQPGGPAYVRDDWVAGLAPTAFAAAMVGLSIAMWADCRARDTQRPSTPLIAATAVVLAAGAWWWAAGASSPTSWWPLIAYVACVPAVGLVPCHIWRMRRSIRTADYPAAWRQMRALSWWSVLVLVPVFVGIIGQWNAGRIYC